MLLRFLIVSLRTFNGVRNTATPFLRPDTKHKKSSSNKSLSSSDRTKIKISNHNQGYFLKIFRFFLRMKVRMKISYSALVERRTVHELLLKSIISTYTMLQRKLLVPPEEDQLDNDLLVDLINGRSNLQMLLYTRLVDMKCENFVHRGVNLKSEFETKENWMYDFFKKMCEKTHVGDIFRRGWKSNLCAFDRVNNSMHNYAEYKIIHNKKLKIYNCLKVIVNMKMCKGQQFLFCMFHKIRVAKELFLLDLEQGNEVRIPPELSLKKLPHSYRFYDALVQIVQTMISHNKQRILRHELGLIRHFDKKI